MNSVCYLGNITKVFNQLSVLLPFLGRKVGYPRFPPSPCWVRRNRLLHFHIRHTVTFRNEPLSLCRLETNCVRFTSPRLLKEGRCATCALARARARTAAPVQRSAVAVQQLCFAAAPAPARLPTAAHAPRVFTTFDIRFHASVRPEWPSHSGHAENVLRFVNRDRLESKIIPDVLRRVRLWGAAAPLSAALFYSCADLKHLLRGIFISWGTNSVNNVIKKMTRGCTTFRFHFLFSDGFIVASCVLYRLIRNDGYHSQVKCRQLIRPIFAVLSIFSTEIWRGFHGDNDDL